MIKKIGVAIGIVSIIAFTIGCEISSEVFDVNFEKALNTVYDFYAPYVEYAKKAEAIRSQEVAPTYESSPASIASQSP